MTRTDRAGSLDKLNACQARVVSRVAKMRPPEYTNDNESTMLHGESNRKKRTPLPWMQLSIVYLIQFAEPITSFVIYPFINQFIQETGITQGDELNTGYFAGIIVRALGSISWDMTELT